jgi:hypothetical protein
MMVRIIITLKVVGVVALTLAAIGYVLADDWGSVALAGTLVILLILLGTRGAA